MYCQRKRFRMILQGLAALLLFTAMAAAMVSKGIFSWHHRKDIERDAGAHYTLKKSITKTANGSMDGKK
jgi:hypothetical protein